MREEFEMLLDRYRGLLARKACADPTLNEKRILDLDRMLWEFASEKQEVEIQAVRQFFCPFLKDNADRVAAGGRDTQGSES